MKSTLIRSMLALIMLELTCPAYCQLKLGSSQSEINFREEPGLNSRVLASINSSNLLVILDSQSYQGWFYNLYIYS